MLVKYCVLYELVCVQLENETARASIMLGIGKVIAFKEIDEKIEMPW